jgi:hypothetical protein
MPNEKILSMGDMPDENRRRKAEVEALIYLVALQAKQLGINQVAYGGFMKIFHEAGDIKSKLDCFETQEAKVLGFKRPSDEELGNETIKFYHFKEEE